ncbi:DUF423 domain-containing protein [Bacteroidota bacterium]
MVRLLFIGFISGALAVLLGAFGKHALEPHLIESGYLDTYQTASNYHFYHTFGIITIGLVAGFTKNKKLESAGWLMLTGLVFFSGSLYILCFSVLKFWVLITPVGGILLVVSWLLAAYLIWKGHK